MKARKQNLVESITHKVNQKLNEMYDDLPGDNSRTIFGDLKLVHHYPQLHVDMVGGELVDHPVLKLIIGSFLNGPRMPQLENRSAYVFQIGSGKQYALFYDDSYNFYFTQKLVYDHLSGQPYNSVAWSSSKGFMV